VRPDLAGLPGGDRNTGGFQDRSGVQAYAARYELADAQPHKGFGCLDAGPTGRCGAWVGHDGDRPAVGIDDQKISAPAESGLDQVFNAVFVRTEGRFHWTPLMQA
jgi:hypothetical protein